MSADKNRSRDRRLALLREMRDATHWWRPTEDLLFFHCEGGMAVDNPDVQRLISDGHITRPGRHTPPKKFVGAFLNFFRPSLHGHAPRRFSRMTEAGRRFLEQNTPS